MAAGSLPPYACASPREVHALDHHDALAHVHAYRVPHVDSERQASHLDCCSVAGWLKIGSDPAQSTCLGSS